MKAQKRINDPTDTGAGIRCPKCTGPVRVLHTDSTPESVRRRRECRKCNHRFNTHEHLEDNGLVARIRAQVRRMQSEQADNLTAVLEWLDSLG